MILQVKLSEAQEKAWRSRLSDRQIEHVAQGCEGTDCDVCKVVIRVVADAVDPKGAR